MNHDPETIRHATNPPRSRAPVVFALVIGLLFGVAAIGSLGWLLLSRNSGRELLSHLLSAVTGRTISIDVSRPNVVDRIQRLQRLETVAYTLDKLLTAAKQTPP